MMDTLLAEDVDAIVRAAGNAWAGRTVLVTGGAGFLGSWLCDALLQLRAEVICLDNFSTGVPENVDHLAGRAAFRIVRQNVEEYAAPGPVDVILHLASRASPEEYQLHPIDTLLSNSAGTHRMLELARTTDATILFTSTSEVYGDAAVIPTPEGYWGNVNPVGVRSCYDEGKRFSEALMVAYRRTYDLDTRIVRIFNTYGPRLRGEGVYGRVISRFLLKALTGAALPVYGDGSQTRSFCYVTDTIRGIVKMTETSTAAKGQVVNLGNPRELTILDLAHTVKRVTASASPITFHPLPEDDPKRRCPDIARAWQLLRWKPQVPLDEGLRRTARWFTARLAR
jgi:UDP-glucuronate decarboxylase